jgi:hypothetical protein
MRGSVEPAASVVAALTTAVALTPSAGRERKAPRESLTVASAGEPGDTCAGDSFHLSAAAPAEGLRLYERPPSLAADK